MNDSNPVTVNNCTGLFFDSGGPDNPPDHQPTPLIKVFAPADAATQKLRVEFSSFDTEPVFSRLDIFNGDTTAFGPNHFGFFDGTNSPGIITSTSPDGKLTFKWQKGGFPNASDPGWEARIYCVPAYTAHFQTTGQSLWAPGVNARPPNSPRFLFLVIDPNELGQGTNVFNILGKRFGGGFRTGTMGDFRFFISASDISPGAVNVQYPVQVTLAGPEKDQFRPGHPVTIDSFLRVKPEDGPSLMTVTPEMILDLDAFMRLTANVVAEICFFTCRTQNLFPSFNINVGPVPFIHIEDRVAADQVSIAGSLVVGNTPLSIPGLIATLTGISGQVDTPELTFTSPTLDGTALVSQNNHQFLDLNIDLDKYYARAAGIQVPLELSGIPLGNGITGSYLIADYDVITTLTQEFQFRFAPTVHISLAFPQPIAFTVRRGGAVVQTGVSAIVNIIAGDSVSFVAPALAMNVVPTISLLNPTFVNQNVTRLRRNYTLKGIGAGLNVPGVHLGCFPKIGVCPVCTPAFCANSPPLNLNFGPFLNVTEPNAEHTDTHLYGPAHREFPLGGFNSVVPASPFEVNPEFSPVAIIDGPAGPLNEGDEVQFRGDQSFDGDGNPLTFTWFFGDGGTGQSCPVTTAGVANDMNVCHKYGDNGVYNVTLVVDDGHGIPGVATQTIVVNNVTPVLPPASPQKVFEGEFTRIRPDSVDPGFLDTFLTTVDFDDLSPIFVFNTFGRINPEPIEFAGHVYADDGTYDVTFCVKDDDGAEACGGQTVEVNNADPTVTVPGFELTQQTNPLATALEVSLRIAILFNDPGTLDTHTARIEWGEGTPDPFPLLTESPFGPPGVQNGANGSAFGEFMHAYSTPGLYEVSACVTDDDGGEGCSIVTTIDVREADLAVTKEVLEPIPPADVVVDSELTYKLTITNNGPNEALDVRVTDLLPAGMALVSATRSGSGVIETKLAAGDPGFEDALGISVGISNDIIVAGAPFRGDAAFVFRASGSTWVEQQELNPTDLSNPGEFGRDVDVSEGTVVVGAPFATDDLAESTGAAYVYVEIAGVWTLQGKLLAGDRLAFDMLGISVATDGDTIVVGASNAGDDFANDAGAAYVFGRTGTVWSELAELHPGTSVANGGFGSDVSISGDTIAVSSPGSIGDGRPGTVTIFRGGGSTWNIERTIVEADIPTLPEANTFAHSVSIDGDTVVVGTREQFTSTQPGAVFVFVRTGTIWAEQAKLVASDSTLGNQFARSVAIHGDTLAVGSPEADNRGAVYAFVRNGLNWSQVARLTATPTGPFSDDLGVSVAVQGQTIVGGMPGAASVDMFGNDIFPGAAYVFAICPEQPPGTVTCGLGTLGIGESAMVEIVARVGCIHATVPFASTALVNTASVSSLAIDPVQANNSALTSTDTAEPPNGLCFDLTPPVVTPIVSGTLGNGGWFTSDVDVSWLVVDIDSPITSETGCGPTTISADTTNTTLTCMATSDGGTTSNSVSIKRDATPPTISSIVTGTLGNNGWHVSDVDVSFVCSDGTSGIASCTAPTTHTDEGPRPGVAGTAVDQAGNSASTTVSGIKIDKTPPVISSTHAPPPNANGWNNSDVTIGFNCTDGVSGIFFCSPDSLFSSEGAGQGVTGSAEDLAGNQQMLTVSNVNIDKTPPTIIGTVSPPANANGWHNTIVDVSFTCADGLSGIDTCTGDTVLNTEGAGQSAMGTAVDLAGNSATDTQSNIDIDFTPPTITPLVNPSPNPEGLNDPPVTVSFVCVDDLSGIQDCTAPIVLSGLGFDQSAAGGAEDLAGNTASASVMNIDIGIPVLSPGSNIFAVEGDALNVILGSVTPVDATTGSATVDWGDGSLIEPATLTPAGVAATISGTHVYADDGVFTVEFCVEDLGGKRICSSIQSNISNAPPQPSIVETPIDPVTLGSPAPIVLPYGDAGTADTHTATVDWGDISPIIPGTVIEAPFGPPGDASGLAGQVLAEHVYAAIGTYSGSVCVTDDENATNCEPFDILVTGSSAPSCSIAVGSVECAGTTVTIPLEVRIQNAGNFSAAAIWTSDNPHGTFVDLVTNDFDDPQSHVPVLTTEVQERFNIFCALAFQDDSGLDPISCQATVSASTFSGIDGCEDVIPCDPFLETADIVCPPSITLPSGDAICNENVDEWLNGVRFVGGDPSAAEGLVVTTDAPGCGFAYGTTTDVTFRATDECGNEESCVAFVTIADAPRITSSSKGSLLVFSKVEIEWNGAGTQVLQDTFLHLTNDVPEDVWVQAYFVNGDTELVEMLNDDGAITRAFEPGWNTADCLFTLTGDQPHAWSAANGSEKCQPFTVLDDDGPGRPDPETNGQTRILRGYVVMWAVAFNQELGRWAEVQWNHLQGSGVLVSYSLGTAWEYNAWAAQARCGVTGAPVLDCVDRDVNGTCCQAENIPGALALDGFSYDMAFDTLLMDFYGSGSTVLSGGNRTVGLDTELTLHPVALDLRQDGSGPVLTKVEADVWNEYESKFSGARRCICCWDQTLLSAWSQSAAVPNYFRRTVLGTDKGKARFRAANSLECDYSQTCGISPPQGAIVRNGPSADAILGLAAKFIAFTVGGPDAHDAAGLNLTGSGRVPARILTDIMNGGDEIRGPIAVPNARPVPARQSKTERESTRHPPPR